MKQCKKHVAPLYHFDHSTMTYARRCLSCDQIVEQITADMVDRMPWELMSPLLQQAVIRHRQAVT